jgi:GNAT superfamily N-acetyltransferase
MFGIKLGIEQMMAHKRGQQTVVATVGYAADADGRGIAYAKIWSTQRAVPGANRSESFVRVGFRSVVRPALRGREIAYAALEAIARELIAAKIDVVELRLLDASLATDLAERRAVPTDLQMPYIALRCTLNRFASFSVVACDDGTARDLTARARAELSLEHAA